MYYVPIVSKTENVIAVRDLAGKFSGSKTFIQSLETCVPEFYEQVGQNLRTWVPSPPRIQRVEGLEADGPPSEVGRGPGSEVDIGSTLAPKGSQGLAPQESVKNPALYAGLEIADTQTNDDQGPIQDEDTQSRSVTE